MDFSSRHIGPRAADIAEMVKALGLKSLDKLIEQTIPAEIKAKKKFDLPNALSEAEFLQKALGVAKQNQIFKTYLGQGYYDCHTPLVILRNILENPGWYTAYTPYQAEISQGRMEALLNFQTMVMELTSMPIANASLLDEGTAAAEAMVMAHAASKKKNAQTFFVDEQTFPQTLEILRTRAAPLGIKIQLGKAENFQASDDCFALFVQYPNSKGLVKDWSATFAKNHAAKVLNVVSADLLSLCLLKAPGEMGADIVVGSTQRFGVPMGFGGPHAAYLSTKDEFKRIIPGRIIGLSKDSEGNPALRLALQTREQHIRREKATSNICTAQVLLAVMASMYAVYHGPAGLRNIASRVHSLANRFAASVEALGFKILSRPFFDTVTVSAPAGEIKSIYEAAQEKQINLALVADGLSIAWDETKTEDDLLELIEVFAGLKGKAARVVEATQVLSDDVTRKSPYLQQAVFNSYHSETELLRYIHRLESKDLALNQAMIPLGSCTMKLNATAEMIPVTWPEFGKIHPFAPLEQAGGYLTMIRQLEGWLCELTGFAGFSLQPNAGSQGEYAGLLVIREYFAKKGQQHRDVCLIPSSAHGTNPASAVMAGMKVVVVACDDKGNVDIDDLRTKADANKANLAALMITYPSTHGVFEETIKEICQIVHDNGGQVYMDGANFNAMVGVCRPADFGADVSHLNLHKTFCIPHGGGGPGVGPIGVAEHLRPFLPGHNTLKTNKENIGAVSSAPWGSASILPISWAYIAMMGADGLRDATHVAILNANYIAKRLEPHFPILYSNHLGYVAHECIVDLRGFKDSAGINVDDVAKRLIDYGFHSPTMSWPVAGTLMIEPTESESKAELDRFIEAMISIRQEIAEVEKKTADAENNVLKNAPHTVGRVTNDNWPHPYSRQKAAFPLPWVKQKKFWPAVSRVDNAFGDKNLVCSCAPLESYVQN